MKILVIAQGDSDNLAIVNVLRELESRGHKLTIYGKSMSENSVQMFEGLKAKICDFKTLTPQVVKEFDLAFTSPFIRDTVLLNIYTFVYSIHYVDNLISEGGDFLFTYHANGNYRFPLKCASMAVGDPKNDFAAEKKVSGPPKKQILYIDSGHMPFGKEGKEQIADMLLKICAQFPEYEICIKPRWLRDSDTEFTHRNLLHLYDVIEERCDNVLPANLNMINEYVDLHQMIDESESVISLYSGAALNVALQDKGLIILKNWKTEDTREFRITKIINHFRDFFGKTGCTVDIDEVTEYLPAGIQCDPAFVESILPHKTGASKRMADTMEFVYKKFLRNGKFPEIRDYSYDTFKKEMKPGELNFSQLKYNRLRNVACFRLAFEYRMISFDIDLSGCLEQAEKRLHKYPLTVAGVSGFYKDLDTDMKACVIDNKEQMMKDKIDQSILLKALNDLNMEDEIFALDKSDILCEGPYSYYMGVYYKKQEQQQLAIDYFIRYLKDANSRPFFKYPQDLGWGISTAYGYIFAVYNGKNVEPETFFDLYLALFENNNNQYVRPVLLRKMHARLPMIATELEEKGAQEKAYACLKLYAAQNSKMTVPPARKVKKNLTKVKQSKSYKIGCIITWIPRKIRDGIQSVRDNGFKRSLEIFSENRKKRIEKYPPFCIRRTFKEQVMAGYHCYAKTIEKYGTNAEICLTTYAIGDAYFFSSMFKAYIEKQQDEKMYVLGVNGAVGKKAAALFSIEHVEPYAPEEFKGLLNLYMFSSENLLHLRLLHHHIVDRHTAILMKMEGIHDIDFFQYIKFYNDIEDEDIQQPVFDYKPKAIAQLFETNGLQMGRTIILSPYAKSCRLLPLSFWEDLTRALLKEGFSVCTNSAGPYEPEITGSKPVFIPVKQLVPIIEAAGGIVGIRSGILDVASSADSLKVSIFMDPEIDFKRSRVNDTINIWSLSKMFGYPNQYDLTYYRDKEPELIEEIVGLAKQTCIGPKELPMCADK